MVTFISNLFQHEAHPCIILRGTTLEPGWMKLQKQARDVQLLDAISDGLPAERRIRVRGQNGDLI